MTALHSFLRRGQRLAAQGAWAAAGEALDDGRRSHPDEPRLAIQRLRLMTEQGEFEEGAQLAALLRERFPEHAPSALFAGKLHFAAKDFASAAAAFTACLELKPGNLLARDYLKLTRWVSQERREALAELLEGQLSHNLDFLSDFAESAERFLRERELKHAPTDAEKLSKETAELKNAASPVDSEAVAAKGEAPHEEDETALAEAEWPDGEVERPALLVRVWRFPGRWREANKRFSRAAKCCEKKDFSGALKEMEQLLAAAPDLIHARTAHAQAHFYLGRFSEAGRELARLEEAAERKEYKKELAEALPFIQSMRGYILIRLGQLEEALELLEKVEPFGPDDFMGYYHRGICLQALGRWREGREQLRMAWSEYQNSTEYYALTRLLTELKMIYDSDQAEQLPAPDKSSGDGDS